MKQTRIIMGMPITVAIVGDFAEPKIFAAITEVFAYFTSVDERFSTYKPASEISQINAGLPREKWSSDMALVMDLCEETRRLTSGYFNIEHDGQLDPSGLVKGWAISNATEILLAKRFKDFYVEAGGDIAVHGVNGDGRPWAIGIRNPFDTSEIIKVLHATDCGVATSGTYIRGQHIYNPHDDREIQNLESLTVIGPNIYEADRYATAAFAMGEQGIGFIEMAPELEGYAVGASGIATFTSGFERYIG